MESRVDSAVRFIQVSPSAVYQAFAEPGTMEKWLPPRGMTARMLKFDFREGGSYRIRLTYVDPQTGQGKTSDNYDDVEVRLVKLIDSERIEQEVTFASEDPAFSGVMRMTWIFQSAQNGTLVTIRAEDVPGGIQPEDHKAGLSSTLDNLALFLQAEN